MNNVEISALQLQYSTVFGFLQDAVSLSGNGWIVTYEAIFFRIAGIFAKSFFNVSLNDPV